MNVFKVVFSYAGDPIGKRPRQWLTMAENEAHAIQKFWEYIGNKRWCSLTLELVSEVIVLSYSS